MQFTIYTYLQTQYISRAKYLPDIFIGETESGKHNAGDDVLQMRLEHFVRGAHLDTGAHIAQTHAVHLIGHEAALGLERQCVHGGGQKLGGRVRAEVLRELLILLVCVPGVAVALDELAHNTGGPLLELISKKRA